MHFNKELSPCGRASPGPARNGSLCSIVSPALGCARRNPGTFHRDRLKVISSASLLAVPNQALRSHLFPETALEMIKFRLQWIRQQQGGEALFAYR